MASANNRLNGKVTIVTGGVKGIGRACADLFAENGAKVAVFDIAEGKSDDENLWFLHCDMKNEDDIKKSIENVVERWGRLDCVVNNAGWHPPGKNIDEFSSAEFRDLFDLNLMGYFLTCKKSIENVVERWGRLDCVVNNAGWHPPGKNIDEFSSAEFRDLFDLNLMGYFLTCKYSLPHLRKTKGNIVNISSIAKLGEKKATIYSATKGGVSSLAKALAVDEAENGVRVNEVLPGAILTPLMEELANANDKNSVEKQLEIVKSQNLMKTFGKPREVAQTVLFLATEATYCTGAAYYVTAGLEMGYSSNFY